MKISRMRSILVGDRMVAAVIVSASLSAACVQKNSQASRNKLVNGTVITDPNVAPAVIKIAAELSFNTPDGITLTEKTGAYASCTAVWVSPDTVMTAAHCVRDNNTTLGKVTITDGIGKGEISQKIYANVSYEDKSASFDVALIVFDRDVIDKAKVATLAKDTPMIGDEISIVGYGKFDHAKEQSGGVKRGGTNKISSFGATFNFRGSPKPVVSDQSQGTQTDGKDARSGTGDGVLNSQGDSGGPMFLGDLKNQQLIGISSTVSVEPGADKLEGHYTNIFYPTNLVWLNSMVDQRKAKIPGIKDAKELRGSGLGSQDPVVPQGPNNGGNANNGGNNNGGNNNGGNNNGGNNNGGNNNGGNNNGGNNNGGGNFDNGGNNVIPSPNKGKKVFPGSDCICSQLQQ